MRRTGDKGFTLIEMVVVIAIIGILAAVLLPNAFKQIQKAKISRTANDLYSVKTGVLQYYADVGSWPATLDDLMTGSADGWDGPYLEKGPTGTNNVIKSGICDIDNTLGCGTLAGNSDDKDLYVSGSNLSSEKDAARLDRYIDGEDNSNSNSGSNSGMLRYDASGLKYIIAVDAE